MFSLSFLRSYNRVALIIILATFLSVISSSAQSNNPPVAVADSYTGLAARSQNNPGLLANDSDPDGDSLSVSSIVTNPAHGYLNYWSGGGFSYSPRYGYTGTDTFVYKVCDALLACSEVTATLHANDPPVGGSDRFWVFGSITVNAPGLLGNDSDPDGDSIKVNGYLVTYPAHGYLNHWSNGSFTYSPNAGYTGTDTFVYKVCDALTACSEVTAEFIVSGDDGAENAGKVSCEERVGERARKDH
jgi:hypothetical protein